MLIRLRRDGRETKGNAREIKENEKKKNKRKKEKKGLHSTFTSLPTHQHAGSALGRVEYRRVS